MKVLQAGGDLTRAYEALRAQATGEQPAVTPRGLALFLAAGFPDWMKAWTPLAPAVAKTPLHHATRNRRSVSEAKWCSC